MPSYGPHLMLDLAQCDPDKLNDLSHCFELLDTLPAAIGMTKITQPNVFRYRDCAPEEQGITGVVIIAESHISLHTYPAKSFVFMDIFSCKPFDVVKTEALCVDWFGCQAPEVNLVERGRLFLR